MFCSFSSVQLGEPSFVGILPKVETENLLQLANTCKITSKNATCSKISLNKTCLKDLQRHAQETTPWSHSNSWCGFPNSFATVILFLYPSYLVIQRHGNWSISRWFTKFTSSLWPFDHMPIASLDSHGCRTAQGVAPTAHPNAFRQELFKVAIPGTCPAPEASGIVLAEHPLDSGEGPGRDFP